MPELLTPTFTEALLLSLAALAAGFVDAIAGGGGLLTLPAIIAVGLPPHLALGTNKGQGVFGSGAALLRFWRAGLVDGKRAPWSFVFGLGGAFAGAGLVLLVRPEILRPLVLVLLVAVAAFLAFRRGPKTDRPAPPPDRARLVAMGVAAVIGAYDGFFGPGTGTFLIIAYVALLGDALTSASANAKVVNFASNLAAVAIFWWNGKVLWAYAIPMAAAQFIGATLGAHVTVKGGDRLVRRVVLVVVLALIAKVGRDLLAAH